MRQQKRLRAFSAQALVCLNSLQAPVPGYTHFFIIIMPAAYPKFSAFHCVMHQFDRLQLQLWFCMADNCNTPATIPVAQRPELLLDAPFRMVFATGTMTNERPPDGRFCASHCR